MFFTVRNSSVRIKVSLCTIYFYYFEIQHQFLQTLGLPEIPETYIFKYSL